MQFSVGQNIVHPSHGAGEIIDVTDEELVEGFKNYYVVKFAKKLTVHIPVRKTDELGVRKIMSRSRLKRVLDTLRKIPGQLPKHYKERRKIIEDLLQSGYPTKIAEAVRELTWRKEDAHLTEVETRLLSQGKDMLATEIALVTDNEVTEVQDEINLALAKAIEAKIEERNNGHGDH